MKKNWDVERFFVNDELNARTLAKIRGINYFEILGLIVASVEKGKIDNKRAIKILNDLAESNFRMSVELYKEVKRRIEL